MIGFDLRRASRALAIGAVILSLAAISAPVARADGTVTVQNPVTSWKIQRIAFTLGDSPTAFVMVGYYRADGSLDHAQETSFSGDEYPALLVAINTSSGNDEDDLTLSDGSPDLRAIFNLRISRFMIAHNKITGATAEPIQ